MDKKTIDTIIDKTTASIDFWGKEFRMKRLKLGSILKIVDLMGQFTVNMQELSDKMSKWDIQMGELSLILASIDENTLYELICIILTWEQNPSSKDINEIENLFNVADLLKLANILIDFEDIETLFLTIREMMSKVNDKLSQVKKTK